MELNMEMLTELTEVRGIAGNEGQVREAFKKYAQEYSEEFLEDGLGGIFGKHTGNEEGPRLLIAGHSDEVGFMVKRITDEGFLTFQTIGGWWSQVVLAQQVEITTREGKVFHGVTGSKPPHVLSPEARKKPIDIDDIFVDIGATSKEQVQEWGIRQGDMITPYIETRRINEDSPFLLAKAWDNRIGVAVAIEALKFAKENGHESVLFSGTNAMEEIGLRGAKVSPNLVKPDIAIAVDTGVAGDTPGMTDKEADTKLGKGPLIMVYDATMVGHKGLREFITDIADENDIPYQFSFMPGGGTDAGSFHITQNGIPSICIALPVRYLHTHTSIIHEDDYKYTVQLVNKIIEKLDSKALETIRKNA